MPSIPAYNKRSRRVRRKLHSNTNLAMLIELTCACGALASQCVLLSQYHAGMDNSQRLACSNQLTAACLCTQSNSLQIQ